MSGGARRAPLPRPSSQAARGLAKSTMGLSSMGAQQKGPDMDMTLVDGVIIGEENAWMKECVRMLCCNLPMGVYLQLADCYPVDWVSIDKGDTKKQMLIKNARWPSGGNPIPHAPPPLPCEEWGGGAAQALLISI